MVWTRRERCGRLLRTVEPAAARLARAIPEPPGSRLDPVEFRLALSFLRVGHGEHEPPLAEPSASAWTRSLTRRTAAETSEDMVSRDQGGGDEADTRSQADGQNAWSADMIAGTAWSGPDTGWAPGEAGWPDADLEEPVPDPAWPVPDPPAPAAGAGWSADTARLARPEPPSRPEAYRHLWQPPGRMPAPRQAIGRPYVWDGGEAAPDGDGRAGGPAGQPRLAAQREETRGGSRRADALTGPVPETERAVIGDLLRELAAWCQIGSCIARYTDGAALGEADIRSKAVAAGWCVDLFGRLICPDCQRRHPVWSTRPPVERDRYRLTR